jgi:rare lipoprotein A
MSASSRPRGRAAENPRAVSYENDASYTAPRQAYLPVDPRGPSEVLSGRGLY